MKDPGVERYKEALKRGHVAVYRGRPRDALTAYQEAARLASHRPTPWVAMGSVLLQMGRVAESIAAYDEALRRAPRDRQALGGKAVALTAAGRAAEAEALEAEVERLDAEEQQLKEEAAASALEAAWGRGPERLIAMASEAAYRGDARAAVDWLLAGAAEYQGLGHLDGTLDACLRALHVAPGAPMVHLQMVRVYLERGWHALAAERLVLLDRLLQLDPDPGVRDEWRRLVATHRDAVPGLASLAP